MSQLPSPRLSLRHSGSLTLRTREGLEPLLEDIRKDSIRFFVPFTVERSPTGKLLPPVSESTHVPMKKSFSNVHSTYPVRLHPSVAFNSTTSKTKPRVKHDRFPCPPPGYYTPEPRLLPSHTPILKSTVSPRFRPPHTRVVSIDSVNYDAIVKDRKHIAGVDMAKSLAREKEKMLDFEVVLNPLTVKLPDHLRKFKGFYDVSGLKSTGMDRPMILEQSSTQLTNQIKERMNSIRRNVGMRP